ncbi:type VI secretion system baseplate subunit TssE [Pseudomonas cannabina]|uniref:ImpF n=1 Tax=Pseudomonas cannabina TaxID=86840 RepID=A0A0P9LUT2_PSECA|nr:type VI secretion system baseplate subunit TssE [Pseudomonas cannabina]KAA8705513.1 type VI secretion system baseplate subunit TssE [Pseudomonas cannabina]KPW74434.1 ImpF [Pseudomonas cannabina]RMN42010.1 ImpF [Pseudomonas cannabina]SDQ98789.1 type VI secretion system protein [Pseudomonas cannabina]
MNARGSLFERLAGQTMPDIDNEQRLMSSIAAHVSEMLGTRAGSVKMLPDYGLPDLNDISLSSHEASRQSRAAIEEVIRTYEPRLFDVHVMPDESRDCPLKRRFSIGACVEINGIRKSVRFLATLSGNGQVRIE